MSCFSPHRVRIWTKVRQHILRYLISMVKQKRCTSHGLLTRRQHNVFPLAAHQSHEVHWGRDLDRIRLDIMTTMLGRGSLPIVILILVILVFGAWVLVGL
jgi:hypothetical protein